MFQSGGILSLLTPGFEANWPSELIPREADPRATAEWFVLSQFNSPAQETAWFFSFQEQHLLT